MKARHRYGLSTLPRTTRIAGLIIAVIAGCDVGAEVNYLPVTDRLPTNGEKVPFATNEKGEVVGLAWRTEGGTTRIRILVGDPVERRGFERRLPSAKSGIAH